MLFWVLVLAVYTFFVIQENRRKESDLNAWAYLTLGTVFLFFLAVTAFLENPLKTLPFTPPDGRGLNPLLQTPSMLLHPVTLYLGYVGFAIPFAYGMAALMTGNLTSEWVRRIRLWVMIPWIFLTAGIVLGGRWAYVELGWGGYWAWDPVENASFIPWLTATAFLHSIIVQERRDLLRTWNLFLVFLTFALTLYGTYITRSGAISSVHAFAQSELGPYFAGFMGAWTVLFLALLFVRRKKLRGGGNRIESLLSREGLFLLNNFLFIALAAVVWGGTTFPMISQIVAGKEITLGPPFFNHVTVPLFLILILLMGIAQAAGWKRTTAAMFRRRFLVPTLVSLVAMAVLFALGVRRPYPLLGYTFAVFAIVMTFYEVWKVAEGTAKREGISVFRAIPRVLSYDKRRYGGYIVHVGVALIAIGIVGSSAFKLERSFSLSPGETVEFYGYQIRFQQLQPGSNPHMRWTRGILTVHKGEKHIGTLTPEVRFYRNWPDPTLEMDLIPTIQGDLYAVLNSWRQDGSADFVLYFNPLVGFIWWGALIMVLGALYAISPSRRARPRARRGKERAEVKA